MTLAIIDPVPPGVTPPRPLLIVENGENTAEARRQAGLAAAAIAAAQGFAEDAEEAADRAEAAANAALASPPYYATIAAGAAATTTPDTFSSDESGEFLIYDADGNPIFEPASGVDVATKARTLWFTGEGNGGDDATGNGTGLTPYETLGKAVDEAEDGDTIQLVLPGGGGTVTIREDIDATALENCALVAPGMVFQGYEDFAGAWTETSGGSGIWKATVSHTFGGAGVHGAVSVDYTGLFGGDTIYTFGSDVLANEAAAIASLTAEEMYSVLGPTVSGTQSNTVNGWVAGNHTYYVRPPDGVDPNDMAWKVQQGAQPLFGAGWHLEGFHVFGGRLRNGLQAQGGTMKRVGIWYFNVHGSFIAGTKAVDCFGIGKNPNGAAGYLWHCFSGGTNYGLTHFLRPLVANVRGENVTVFGGHGGTGYEDPTDYIVDLLRVDDLLGYDVRALGGSGQSAQGNVFRRPRIYGLGSVAPVGNTVIDDPVLVGGPDNEGTTALWACPEAGATLTVNGGSSANAPNSMWMANGGSVGAAVFRRHIALVRGETANFRWMAASTHEGITLEDGCALQGDGTPGAFFNWGQTSSGDFTVNGSAISGLDLPTTTFADAVKGGDLGIYAGPDGSAQVHPDSPALALGELVLSAQSHPQSHNIIYLVTTGGLLGLPDLFSFHGVIKNWVTPAGVTLRGALSVYQQFAGNWLVLFGDNGVVYRYDTGSGDMDLLTTGVATNFVGAVTDNDPGTAADGKVHLLGDGGEILEWAINSGSVASHVITGATLTSRTSGIAYPLLGGVRVGANMLVWGQNEAGSSGGARYSTNTGASWSAAHSEPSAAGGAVNSIFFTFGQRGKFKTAGTVNGSWTDRSINADAAVKDCAIDTAGKRVLWGGEAGLGPLYRRAPMGFIDASEADPADWEHSLVDCPTGNTGACAYASGISIGGSPMGYWICASKAGRYALSEDPVHGWSKTTPLNRTDSLPRYREGDPLLAAMLASA